MAFGGVRHATCVCEVEEQNRELEDSKGSEHCGLTVHMEDEAVDHLEGRSKS